MRIVRQFWNALSMLLICDKTSVRVHSFELS
jgi:hypothetical protein